MYKYFKSHHDARASRNPTKELVSWFKDFKKAKIPCILIKLESTTGDNRGLHQLWREGEELTGRYTEANGEPLPRGSVVMKYRWEHK